MYGSQVKYSPLTNLDENDGSSVLDIKAMGDQGATFQFDSAFTYDTADLSDIKRYGHKSNFNSAFRYSNLNPAGGKQTGHLAVNIRDEDENAERERLAKPSTWMVLTSWVLTFLSYLFFIITAPITYWIFVKKMGEFDRLVVFRLGKMIGVKGPGRVIVFPWMDRTKRIDVRAAAFAVPPQQFITCDGGIVEMGAEIQYGIVDVVTMISEVADHQDILRSLSKTLLIKILVKKTVRQVEKERRRPATEIQDELNDQVRKWGIDVQKVELSEPKVLKQPENGSSTAMGSILKGLGMKSDPKYPTPEEFVRVSHGLEDGQGNPTAGHVSALGMADLSGGGASMNMSLLQMMTNNMTKNQQSNNATVPAIPGMFPPVLPNIKPGDTAASTVCSWGRCLDVILQTEFNGPLDDDACGLYKIEITETEAGVDTYFIDLSPTSKKLTSGTDSPDGRNPDVSVQISSSDLASVLEGTLAPLQAYLTGRIAANGDVRKLMFFDKLSKRGHKPGTMFNV